MKTINTLKLFIVSLLLVVCFANQSQAQVEIEKFAWTAHAFRYQEDNPISNAIDGYLENKFGMGGSASERRWVMIDLGESHDVVKVVVTYVPGEVWKSNYILGFDVYVTDKVFPYQPAAGPKGSANDGDLFEKDAEKVTASIAYPEATEVAELEFEATTGRYVWIVSNGPTGDWWEIHEFTAYVKIAPGTNVNSLEIPVFTMFPNPVRPNSNLTVNIENGIGGELRIIDMTGRVVYSDKNLTQGQNILDVNLNSGMYIVSIPGQKAQKLIVR